MATKITVRCVGCKSVRDLTPKQAASGRPFCPHCGNVEIAVARRKLERAEQHHE